MTKIIQDKLAFLPEVLKILKNRGAMDKLMYNALEPIMSAGAWHALYDVINTLNGVSITKLNPNSPYTKNTVVRINYSNSKKTPKACKSIW